jgi:hypothetical protein
MRLPSRLRAFGAIRYSSLSSVVPAKAGTHTLGV